MAYREHDFRHLIEGDQALDAGKGKLCRRERCRDADGVAVLTGDLDESPDGIADEAEQVRQGDRGGIE